MSKKDRISSLRGMRDILPNEQVYWAKLKKATEKVAQNFNFRRIDTPIVEAASLFERTVGEGTDIVEKEMYSFRTKGKEIVALRPEFTASIARAFIENGLDRWAKPIKLYSWGPLFRYERPQEGRYRQHHQIDFEVLGSDDPVLDAQVIMVAQEILNKIGAKNIDLYLNSIGCGECRKPYVKSLVKYYKSQSRKICSDCRKRIKKNPLRVLDCKEEKCQPIIEKAPQAVNALCDACKNHFKKLLEYLDEIKIDYSIEPSLVRGLDYYNRTVFEFVVKDDSGKRQGSLAGGGRYDGLIKRLGGVDTPAIGFGMGMERVVSYLKKENKAQKVKLEKPKNLVFLIQLGDLGKKRSLQMFQELQKTGISVAESFGKGSLKGQLKAADKAGAKVALIIGQKEALDETVIVRNMVLGSQEVVPRNRVMTAVKREIKN